MVSKTHAITLSISKSDIGRILGTSFAPEKNKLTCFFVIAIKPVDFMLEKIINNIKEVNQNYVIA